MGLFGNFTKIYQIEILSRKDMQPFMIEVNVGQRGEIVIPKKAREALGIGMGGRIRLHVKESSAELFPVEENVADRWKRLAEEYGRQSKGKITYDSDAAYDEMMEDQQENVRRY
jgi:AbrB family looped-hinge helix DNA binding protein